MALHFLALLIVGSPSLHSLLPSHTIKTEDEVESFPGVFVLKSGGRSPSDPTLLGSRFWAMDA